MLLELLRVEYSDVVTITRGLVSMNHPTPYRINHLSSLQSQSQSLEAELRNEITPIES